MSLGAIAGPHRALDLPTRRRRVRSLAGRGWCRPRGLV